MGTFNPIAPQGYAQAASWNRIPIAAWCVVTIISMFCNFLIGNSIPGTRAFLSLILPIVLSAALALMADIDSPRNGLIYVQPTNLESLADSLPRAEGHEVGTRSRNPIVAAPNVANSQFLSTSQ